MKKLLNEEVKYNLFKNKRDGKIYAWIFGTNQDSNNLIFQSKDIISQYGATFNKASKKWTWTLSDDQDTMKRQIRTMIIPCIKAITTMENHGERDENVSNEKIQKFIDDINKVLKAPVSMDDFNSDNVEGVDINDIKTRLAAYKEQLISITSDEDFKALFEPIIKMRQAMGPGFSLLNSLLVWIQDPDATMVKSRGNWKKCNREIVKGATPIALYLPHGKPKYPTQMQRDAVKNDFLKKHGVQTLSELTVGEREELDRELNSFKEVTHYTLEPNWFDHRFTELMKNKEDLAPRASIDGIDWWDKDAALSDKTTALYDAAVKVITSLGIKIEYKTEEEMGGARGVSRSDGTIDVIKDNVKNIDDFGTLIHEFAHSLLHQEYVKKKSEEWARFFIGRGSRGSREQQADLTSWIVCRYFGFDRHTSINYTTLWGMDAKKAPKVFDTVGEVASEIISKIIQNMKTKVTENINENDTLISGLDVANMLGLGKLYKSKKNEFNEEFIREMVRKTIEESVNNIYYDRYHRNPYDHKKSRDGRASQPLRDSIDLYDIRSRLGVIRGNCNEVNFAIANKQIARLYKMVDSMINQGFYVVSPGSRNNNTNESCVKECNTNLKESEEAFNYTHFAVNKNNGLIVNGWDYSGYDNNELKQSKKDYFLTDLIENDFDPKDYKILTRQGCIKQGINPDDIQNCWSNRGDISLKDGNN